MNRRMLAEMSRLCVEKLLNSGLLGALFALIQNISSRHDLDPELIRDSVIILGDLHFYLTRLILLSLRNTQCQNAVP
jgi:hypothetical protein